MPSNSTKKIFLASNSQGTSAGISRELNYPNVLKNILGSGFEVHWMLISGWTLQDYADNLVDNVISVSPDFVIMNFGIVECAQRILSNWEKKLFSLVPGGATVTGLLHRNRASVLKFRNFLGLQARQASLEEYSASLCNIASRLSELNIPYLFVRIPQFPDNGNALDHPYINQDIFTYNTTLDRYMSISIEGCAGGWSMDDYQAKSVHFSVDGHRKIAELLSNEIANRLS